MNEQCFIGENLLIDGMLYRYMGQVRSNASSQPLDVLVSCYTPSMGFRLEYKEYGHVTYPLKNLRNSYQLNQALRDAVRRYEDYVIAKLDGQLSLQEEEEYFYQNWILSRP